MPAAKSPEVFGVIRPIPERRPTVTVAFAVLPPIMMLPPLSVLRKVAVLKAFTQSKAAAIELLSDTSATKVTLPFVEEQLKTARDAMGEDYWSYGVAGARKTLETFVRAHHSQGLSPRLVPVDELFHPSTYETYSI